VHLALAGPGFALLLDAGAAGSVACAPSAIAGPALTALVLEAEASLGVDAELAVVLTSAAVGCDSIYYLPLANDVRGIGYAHHDPREVFDDTPEHRLEGVAFLNDWPYWLAHPGELESAFNHELGHRYGARVHARVRGESSAALLGRDREHWSYFFSSGGSPLEGNVWVDTAAGYISDTPLYPSRFAPLDLYLMGVLPATMVPPERLLLDVSPAGEDCTGQPIGPSSPPQSCQPRELTALGTLVSIEDIIAVEGAREPAPDQVPRSVDVLTLVLHSSELAWSTAECDALRVSLRDRLEGFADATAGRLRLQNVLGEVADCAELSAASQPRRDETRLAPGALVSGAPGCSFVARPGSGFGGLLGCIIAMLAGAMRRELLRGRGS
jgi:hypothetical protein